VRGRRAAVEAAVAVVAGVARVPLVAPPLAPLLSLGRRPLGHSRRRHRPTEPDCPDPCLSTQCVSYFDRRPESLSKTTDDCTHLSGDLSRSG